MSEELIVTLGEYLGRLPFTDEAGATELVDAHMLAGQLVRLSDAQAETLAFCRTLRTRAELTGWLDAEGIAQEVAAELIAGDILRSGPLETVVEWLGDAVLVPSGRSVGWVDEKFLILRSDESVVSVSHVSYWLWLYARAGNTLAETVAFLATQADINIPGDEELGSTIAQMLMNQLVRAELRQPAAHASAGTSAAQHIPERE